MFQLRDFSESDIQQIVDLRNQLFPASKHWNHEDAKAQLTDLARGQGKNVVMAVDNDKVIGAAGWVSAKERGEFYGAPFLASTSQVAESLLKELLKHAKSDKANLLKIGAYQFEKQVLNALRTIGFKKDFEFIEVEIQTAHFASVSISPIKFKYVSAKSVEPSKYMNLFNASFKNVANAPAATKEQAKEFWGSNLLDTELSGAWEDKDGSYVAYIMVHKKGYLDSIGVSPNIQRQGLGHKIYNFTFQKASKLGIAKLHATIGRKLRT